MMTRLFLYILFASTFYSISIFGQGETITFLDEMKKYDYSEVFMEDSIKNEYFATPRLEPIGFFGSNYQRFYVHFISVIKDQNNPLRYFVYGKAMLSGTISTFQGTITITNSSLYTYNEIPNYKQGVIEADYIFYEDHKSPKTGFFFGKCKSYFSLDLNNVMAYDALMLSADGFENNLFEGQWKSYSSSKSYVCNWGDYRIPNSGELDLGAGEFGANEMYFDRGWRTYEVAKGYGTNATKEEIEKARQIEAREWWK